MIDSTASAFVAGLVTSLHCAGMCGPMACAWAVGKPGGGSTFLRDTALYHGARIASYVVIGTVAGTFGIMPMKWFQQGGGLLLPWLLVGMFVLVALGLERRIPKPGLMKMPMARMKLWAMGKGSGVRGAMVGFFTPLLPCGPLYLMVGLAMAHGSALGGAQFALAFGMGTLPLLWLAQTQLRLLNLRLGPRQMQRLQRGLAFGAAVVMAWRLRGSFAGEVAACCH